MANEANLQHLANDMAAARGLVKEARDFLSDVRAYALDLKALVAAGAVSVQNFPSSVPVTGPLTDGQMRATAVPVTGAFFPATQPVSGSVDVGALPAPVVGATAAVSLTSTGDLVAAQGAGVAIRLLAAIVSATTAVTISLRNGAADVIPIRLATNGVAVLPFVAGGWMTTDANTALRVAFAGLSTVTAYALWSEG